MNQKLQRNKGTKVQSCSRRRRGYRRPWKLEAVRFIELTWGKYAIVDAEDYDRLNSYKWCAVKEGCSWYAKTFRRDGFPLPMHRLITDAPKGLFVDHINHNGLDNRKQNLRLCTRAQNNLNQRPYGKTSRYKGVSRYKRTNRYIAAICYQGKRFHLGYFKDEIDAAKAYDKKARELFGEFAYLNFPQESSGVQSEGSAAKSRTNFNRKVNAGNFPNSNSESRRATEVAGHAGLHSVQQRSDTSSVPMSSGLRRVEHRSPRREPGVLDARCIFSPGAPGLRPDRGQRAERNIE